MEYSEHILPVVEGKCLPQCKWVLEDGKWKKVWWYPEPAVEPICQIIFDVPYYFCGNCKTMLNMYAVKAKYCSNCGTKVKWE